MEDALGGVAWDNASECPTVARACLPARLICLNELPSFIDLIIYSQPGHHHP